MNETYQIKMNDTLKKAEKAALALAGANAEYLA